MMTHTRKCLLIKLVCIICNKEYNLAENAEKHIKEMHDRQCSPEALSKPEGEDVVASVATEEMFSLSESSLTPHSSYTKTL